MNQLNNISLASATMSYPTISGGTFNSVDHIGTSAMASVNLSPDCTIHIGDHKITAAELSTKLRLLDRLIAHYLPEELI